MVDLVESKFVVIDYFDVLIVGVGILGFGVVYYLKE